ncbi:MAG: AMP-binding protein [Rhizobiales bacterium]|nr:AMP-binding protein [Hyphomicrobiales bacterium]
MSVTAALGRHAAEAPGRDALVFEDARLSWRDLDHAAHRLAGLIAATTPAGGGVALHLPTGPALALIFLAAARAGREAQVLDPDWPEAMTRGILAELAPAVTVTAEPGLAGERTIVLADPLAPFQAVEPAFAVAAEQAFGHKARAARVAEPDAGLPFYVGFTSGSTGLPKGYRRDHRSWTESFRGDAQEFGIGPDDVVLAPGTLTHSLFLYALVHGLHAGARVVLCRRFRPDLALRLIEREQATVLYGVPTQLQLMLDAAGDKTFASLRWVLSSGAKWPRQARQALSRAFPESQFAEFYGASETSFITVAKAAEGVPETSVGRAFSGVRVTIRDRAGRRMPAGRAGFVFVESPFLFMNYACGETADLLRQGDALSVGDIGYLDRQGFLHLVGRAARKIVTSAKNVYPEEIERVLESHPAVEAAAVLGVADIRRGERLVALVRLRPDLAVAGAALIAHARLALPLYKVPRLYAEVSDWPLTRSGKTDFEALGQTWAAGRFTRLR